MARSSAGRPGRRRHVQDDLAPRIKRLVEHGVTPGLGTILVGDDRRATGYVRLKQRRPPRSAFGRHTCTCPSPRRRPTSLAAIDGYNDDPAVDAILVQHPSPPHLDYEAALLAIDPDKDADGLHPVNLGRLVLGVPGPVRARPRASRRCSCTTRSRSRAARRDHRARLHDRPPALEAAVAEGADRERDRHRVPHRAYPWPQYTKQADIVVAAAGVPGSCNPTTFGPGPWSWAGATIQGRKLLPDVDEACAEVAGWITPRLGGVGPTTRAMLFRNTVEAAERRAGIVESA